jgi:hypothetical protein
MREELLLGTRKSGRTETEMKRSVLCSWIVATALMAGPVARAEDFWGCEVMLCLASPRAGPASPPAIL